MTSIPKAQTEIPSDFPIKRIPPKTRKDNECSVKPKATSRLVSWDIAQSMAPYAGLTYDQQIAKTETIVKSNLTNWSSKEENQ